MPISKLRWGLAYAVPLEATGAWGCRAITGQDGHVDLVPDRTDQVGEEFIFGIFTSEYNPSQMRQELGELLRSGQMVTTRSGRFSLYESRRLTVMADMNASGGYCYIAAWTTVRLVDDLAERAIDVIDQAVTEGRLPG
jgi:hypothetical protein